MWTCPHMTTISTYPAAATHFKNLESTLPASALPGITLSATKKAMLREFDFGLSVLACSRALSCAESPRKLCPAAWQGKLSHLLCLCREYTMLIGNGVEDKGGCALMYKSQDLRKGDCF